MSGDSYELLEVDKNSTIEEIRKEYYELKWFYDRRKELGTLNKDKEDEFSNITKAYHELSTNEHHLILSGYSITLAINDEDHRAYPVINATTDKQLTEEEIEDILKKGDIALQELQDQEEKEVEEKFKKVDLQFQEIKDQQEDKEMEEKFARVDLLLEIVEDREHIKLKKQEIKQLNEEIKLLAESFRLSDEIVKLCCTIIKLLDQKSELSRQLREKNVPSSLNEDYYIERKKREIQRLNEEIKLTELLRQLRGGSVPSSLEEYIEEKKREIEQLSEEIKLLVKKIELSGEWTELLETKTELSEQLNELRTRCELKASYQKKSKIFMTATGVFIIVDPTIAVLFLMNLVSSEIMLPLAITSAAVSLICISLAIYYSNQAFIEVDTKLLNSTNQLNIEKFSQSKKIPPCS